MTSAYLTPKQVAELLQIPYESALSVIKYSGIDYIKVGRQYRVKAAKLERHLNQKGETILNTAEK